MNKYIVTLSDDTKEEVLAHGVTGSSVYGGAYEPPLAFFDYERPFQFPVDESEAATETRAVEYDEFGEPYDYPVPITQRVYPTQVTHTIFKAGTWKRVVRVAKGLDD